MKGRVTFLARKHVSEDLAMCGLARRVGGVSRDEILRLLDMMENEPGLSPDLETHNVAVPALGISESMGLARSIRKRSYPS